MGQSLIIFPELMVSGKGDSLSPYLFVLSMERLALKINELRENGV